MKACPRRLIVLLLSSFLLVAEVSASQPFLLQTLPAVAASTSSHPVIVGWGGTKLDETVTFDPGNPQSAVFGGEQASNAEVEASHLAQLGYDGWRLSFAPFCTVDENNFMGVYNSTEVQRGITIAQHYGLWIIIDYHGYYDIVNSTGVECWLNFWRPVVQHFMGSYDRIAWEPINEPTGFGDNGTYLTAQYQSWIDQARSLGDNHWIVVQNVCSYSCGFDDWADGYPTVRDGWGRVFISIHSYMYYTDWQSMGWNNSTADFVAWKYYQTILEGQNRTGWPSLNTEGGAVPCCSSSNSPWPPDTIVNGGRCPGCNGGSAGYSVTSFHFIQTLTNLYDANPHRVGWLWWPMASWTDTPGAGELGALGANQWGSQLHFQSPAVTGGPGNAQQTLWSMLTLVIVATVFAFVAILSLVVFKRRQERGRP